LNYVKSWKFVLVILMLLGPSFIEAPTVSAQTTAHLNIYVTGQSMKAGFNNNMTVTVVNNYSGYIAIYDVGLSISVPAPLALLGDSDWHFDSIQYGQNVTPAFQVYVPSSAEGSSYLGTLTATYKQLGDISYTEEIHDLSLTATGYINLTVYGIELTPSVISPGGNTTVSGNVLNDGNLASYNANVTVESDILVPGPQNSVFLGEVDPNIPRPFSVLLVFKSGLAPGNYTFTIKVSATDNNYPNVQIIGQGNAQVQVIKAAQSIGPTRGESLGVIGLIMSFLRNLFNTFFGSSTG